MGAAVNSPKSPQHQRLSSLFRAHAWLWPAETAVQSLSTPTCVGSVTKSEASKPTYFHPQHQSVASLATAQVNGAPTVIWLQAGPSVTSAGTFVDVSSGIPSSALPL